MPTILVIDDEHLQHGHEVFAAYNGREGLALHKDLHLPDMTGIEVLRQIRESDSKAAVMILTGAGSDKLERQAQELGVTDFLIKGLSPNVLIEAVTRGLPPQSPTETCLPTHEKHNGASILVVDDERPICDMLTKYLTPRGYHVYTAQNGRTALTLAERERPRLIVLDIYMPGMDGVEVLRKLRARQYKGGVMMLTGCEDRMLLKDALDLGSLDIVGKPFDLERLGIAIEVSLILAVR
jgi:DNA-binding response OmpR family regulator